MFRNFKLLFLPLDGGGSVGNVGAGLKPAPTLPLPRPSREGLSLIRVVAEGGLI